MSNNLSFSMDINAPKEKVWELMLGPDTYPDWTGDFHEGSFYEGSWEKGATIRFLAEDDGRLGGMVAKVVENIPGEYVSVEMTGLVADGKDIFDDPDAESWKGSLESYRFTENNGVTTVNVELIGGAAMNDEIAEMFKGMWPPALKKLKEICER